MSQTMPYAINVHADAALLDFSLTRTLLLQEALEHELPVLDNTDDTVRVASPLGVIAITAREEGLRMHIATSDENALSLIRSELMTHLDYHAHDLIKDLHWSDNFTAGQTPPNFGFATVLSSNHLCKDFVRLELQLEQGHAFTSASIHFRFAIPSPDNIAPEWPVLLENGSTQWPNDEKSLHRTVYTAQNIDTENAIMTVDIFRHKGGRTCQWAEQLSPLQHVALIGPGGGGALAERHVVLCGDETAYPAIAHILRTLPKDAMADVTLLNHNGLQDYPMPSSNRINIHWISPASSKTLAECAFTTIEAKRNHYLWFAANNKQVAQIRELTKPLKLDKKKTYLAAFWTSDE